MAIKRRNIVLLLVIVLLTVAVTLLWLARKNSQPVELGVGTEWYSGGTTELGDTPAKPEDRPRDVITWLIKIKKDNDVIGIDYDKDNIGVYRLKDGESIEDYLKLLAHDKHPSGFKWKEKKWEDRPPTQDRETPLSIRHTGHAYMVFVLEKANWEFTPQHDPFEVLEGKEKFYLDPKCAWLDGTTPRVERQPDKAARCRIASFISNAKANIEQAGDDNGHFVSPFNFYISIRVQGKKRARYLPLVIDPDVGYPGGNYPVEAP